MNRQPILRQEIDRYIAAERVAAKDAVDSVRFVTIKVTQDCIDKSRRDDPRYCPVAVAIRQLVPKATIIVSMRDVLIAGSCVSRVYVLPEIARKFIEDDRVGRTVRTVRPFEFRLLS